MKILLISPASSNWRGISRRRLFNGKTFRFSMLSLLTVAKLSPPDAESRIVDEQVEEVSSMTDLLTLVRLAGDNMLQVEARLRHEMMARGKPGSA